MKYPAKIFSNITETATYLWLIAISGTRVITVANIRGVTKASDSHFAHLGASIIPAITIKGSTPTSSK